MMTLQCLRDRHGGWWNLPERKTVSLWWYNKEKGACCQAPDCLTSSL
jgi:hypothetical protein